MDSLLLSHQGSPKKTLQFSSVQSLSHVRLCSPMNRSMPGLPVHHQLPEFTQTHVHQVSDAIRPLILLPLIPPSIRVFSSESTLHMRWPKYWSFSFSISPSNEHPGLVSFRMDWLDLLAVQRTRKSLLQHHSSKASILFFYFLFYFFFKSINSSALSSLHSPILTSIHDHRKNHSLN